ncbi:MAG: response regulator, partial [Rhodospirillaceae bacterium]|nr:response regulator [Rhodospirillaceae bacterium]
PTIEPSGEIITETLLVDIDEQVRKEKWLAAVVTALDSSQDSIVIEGQDRKVIYANRAANEGVRGEGRLLVGNYLHEVFTDTEPGGRHLYRRIRKSITKYGHWRDTVVYRNKAGVATTHDMRVAEIPGGGLLYATTDVTDVKARIAREADLQLQLAETQKLESLGRLAGGVAHDFNNILAATRAFADLIVGETPAGSRPNTYASRIVTACQRAANLVGQILTFSRAQDAVREPVSLADVISEAETILRGRLPANTTLQVPSAPQGLSIWANEGQVVQIILNLAINASDALNGELGKVALTTGLTRIKVGRPLFTKGLNRSDLADSFFYASAALRPGTDYVCLTCRDNGTGIPADIALKIFDPFFTTKQKRSGSGLGLAVVNSIVAANNGVITVRSRVGVGTTFDIYWPVYVSDKADMSSQLPASTNDLRALNGTERILIVDDEEDVADALSIALGQIGYRTTVSYSSTQALKLFLSYPLGWDVVISDQIMPDLRGLDLIQRMKAANPRLKAILCTGYSDKSGEDGALMRGADLFFMKPAPATALAAGIRQLLDKTS